MDLREFPPISFSSFIQTKHHMKRCDALPLKKALKPPYRMADLSGYLSEDAEMTVGIGYNEAALFITVHFSHPFSAAYFPEIQKGDGLEIFVSTRRLENVRSMTKFCHHFVVLPKEIDGFKAAEVTKFRSDEKRDLASEESILVDATFDKKGYTLEVVLSDKALYQFDPTEYPHLRFALKAHRYKKPLMHMPQSSLDYKIERYPELWAELVADI